MARMPSISATRSASAAGCGRLHAFKRTSAAATAPQDHLANGRFRKGMLRRCMMDLIEFENFRPASDDEWCTLMNRLRLDVHDPEFPAGRVAPGLFGDEGEWVGFV